MKLVLKNGQEVLLKRFPTGRIVTLKEILKNNIKRNKMLLYPREDLTGKTFSKLTVLYFHTWAIRWKDKAGYWLCQCYCGEYVSIEGRCLIGKMNKSCGCWHGNELEKGEANFNALYGSYHRQAKNRNLKWDLDKEFFRIITKQDCNYCGAEPKLLAKRSNTLPYLYNGIDRIDNNLGYQTDNVVACCKLCNFMKLTLSKEEFYDHIRRIIKYLNLDESKND